MLQRLMPMAAAVLLCATFAISATSLATAAEPTFAAVTSPGAAAEPTFAAATSPARCHNPSGPTGAYRITIAACVTRPMPCGSIAPA